MSDEPVIAASAAGKDTNEFFIAAARASCEMSIKNTGVGRWLRQALNRLEESEAENERLRERATSLTKLCSDRLAQRWDDNAEYRAEILRLRAEIDKQRLVSESVFDETLDLTEKNTDKREVATMSEKKGA